MKNFIKFILRMAVTACIVVGAIAIVMHFTNKDANKTVIADTSANLNISTKLKSSHQNLVSIVKLNNQNSFSNKANYDVIYSIVQVNDVLEKYYDYYITLTSFENSQDNNLKNTLVNKIKNLNEKIEISKQYLNQLNSASNSNYIEKNARIVNLFGKLCSQTETLFEVCNLLRDYVCVVNYQTYNFANKTEAVLEMAKDYAKVVYDAEIKSNIYATKSIESIIQTDFASFKITMQKTLESSTEKNTLTEINFVYSYNNIQDAYLSEFYKKNYSGKSNYVDDISNFLEEAPEGETQEQAKIRMENAEQQQSYLRYLFNFMVTTY